MGTFFPTVIQAFGGFGFGHDLVGDVVATKTYLTGKNPYLPIPHQFSLVSNVFSLALRIFESYKGEEASFRVKLLCNVFPLATLPIFYLVAALGDDQYPLMKDRWNQVVPERFKLPERLNDNVRSIAEFISEHTTEVVRVACAVGLMALIPLGQPVYSLFAFSALAYDLAVRNNKVSLENRLLGETYLPAIALVGNLLEGTALTRFETLCWEPVGFAQDLTIYLQNKMDAFFKRIFFFLKAPTLDQTDRPLIRPPAMNFQQMEKILAAKKGDFTLNPAHFTKEVSDLYPMEENGDYQLLLGLFDKVSWQEKYPLVLGILCDDDQFIGFLKGEFPREDPLDFHQKTYPENVDVNAEQRIADRKALKSRIDGFIQQLANKKGVSKEQFAAGQLKLLMESFVRVMEGKETREGDQHHTGLARGNTQKLIPILLSMDPSQEVDTMGLTEHYAAAVYAPLKREQQRQNFEDCLLNLAACGGYCTAELDRETQKLKDAFLAEKASSAGQSFEEILMEKFEIKLLQALAEVRHRVVQGFYAKFIDFFMYGWPESVKKNMHIASAVETFVSLGFYPISKHERSEISIVQFLLMEVVTNFILGNPVLERVFGPFFKDFKQSYEENLKDALGEVAGEFSDYITHLIRQKDLFTDQEQASLIDRFTDPEQAKEMEEKFFHLTLYRLGVLQLTPPEVCDL